MIVELTRLASIAIMGLGVFSFFPGLYLLLKRRWLLRAGITTSGTIIELRERTVRTDEGKYTFVRPTVRFVTSSGTFEFKSNSGEPAGKYSIGQGVSVRYLPERPTIAEIETVVSQTWILWALLAGGFICLGLGFPFLLLAIR